MELRPYRRKAYYYETDRMDIVHHSNYVRWFEEARVDIMEQLGYPFDVIEANGIVSPVLKVEAAYKFPVRFGDEFEVRSTLVFFNGSRFALDYEVFNITAGQVSCLAHSEHCFADTQLRPIRLKNKLSGLYESMKQALKQSEEVGKAGEKQ